MSSPPPPTEEPEPVQVAAGSTEEADSAAAAPAEAAADVSSEQDSSSPKPQDEAEKISMAGSSSSSTLGLDDSSSDLDIQDEESPPADPTEVILQAVSLKEEGNACFKDGDLTKASRSYRKGTLLLKKINKNNTGDDQVKSLLVSLQTNLSFVSYKQNKPKQSRDVATKALSVDPTHVKALYRRAVAWRKLNCPQEARADLKEALKHDPNNVTVKRELLNLKKETDALAREEKMRMKKAFSSRRGSLYKDKEEEKAKKAEAQKRKKEQEAEALKKRKQQWEDECVKLMAKEEEPLSYEDWDKREKERELEEEKRLQEEKKKQMEERKQQRKLQKKQESSSDEEEELTEQELAMFRGYKKTTDGRTTSYFTREQSEAEKQLIGDIAPKRLGEGGGEGAPVQISPVSSSDGKNTNASAWNQAGTWEEKDTSDWCSDHLRNLLLKACSEQLEGGATAVVTKVKDLVGHASVAVTGGKKRYIFDFHALLDYEIRLEDDCVASAQLKLPDISSTTAHDEHELEVEMFSWQKVPSIVPMEDAAVCRDKLVQAVRACVQAFVTDFNHHY